MAKPLVLLTILCVCFVLGEATIKCFSCNYPDEKCGDKFAYINPDAVGCSGVCVKRRGVRGDTRTVEVYRGCHIQTENLKCGESTYNNMNVMECFCDDDYCNHGNTVRMSILSLLLAGLALLYNIVL